MSHSLSKEFGPLRSFFWPIHPWEMRKLMPMLLMLFLICFNYSILRNMKDSLVVTTSGAAVIPFIKVWAMLPMAVLLTFLFTRLTNRYSQEKVFYIMISMFLTFFALFAFVLYPLRDYIQPQTPPEALVNILPIGLRGMLDMCCNWSFTIFYVMCELWSTSILTVLFWGFANEITSVAEARRFYGVLGVGASCAAIFAGQFANLISSSNILSFLFPFARDSWEYTMDSLILIVIFCGIATIGTFRWMSRSVLTDPEFDAFHSAKIAQKAKSKLSVKESFVYLSRSKYLLCIAVIVVAYNLVINMTEILWKDQLSRLYPTAIDYNIYMNNLTSAIGLCATLTALFMAKIIDRLGWTYTAMIAPVMMLLTGIGFFSFFLYQDYWSVFPILAGSTPLVIAVFFGAAQNCLSKASKYSVFDTTKEMAFIPLDHDCKLKGKAAIDGVGSRIGKSGGSIMYQGLLMFFATVSASAPYVAAILAVVLGLWMIAVYALGKQFNALVASKEDAAREKIPKKEWEVASEAQVASS